MDDEKSSRFFFQSLGATQENILRPQKVWDLLTRILLGVITRITRESPDDLTIWRDTYQNRTAYLMRSTPNDLAHILRFF